MNLVCQHECKENAHNGNTANAFQATMEQPSRTVVHAKLEMTTPDSQEEAEADAAANDIVQGGKIARSVFAGGAGGGMAVSSQMEGRLNSLQGGGQVMPDGLRNMMERGFNRDFSQVRLHTDSEAASLSSSIHAKAFTHGNDIYFNQGQFSPNTSEGQKLMAHELTHVVQGGGKVGRDVITDEVKSDHMKDENCAKVSHSWFTSDKCDNAFLNESDSKLVNFQLLIAKYMVEYVIKKLPNLENDTLYKEYFSDTSWEETKSRYAKILNVIDKSLYSDNELYIHMGVLRGAPNARGRECDVRKDGSYPLAYVDKEDHYYEIALCPRYFESNSNFTNDIDKNIDRAAVLIHELSHEELNTEDITYNMQECKRLSKWLKVKNAQNYSLFAKELYLRKDGDPLN